MKKLKSLEAVKKNSEVLEWMDKRLTFKFIQQMDITDEKEVTNRKLAIWDFLTEFEEKFSVKK